MDEFKSMWWGSLLVSLILGLAGVGFLVWFVMQVMNYLNTH